MLFELGAVEQPTVAGIAQIAGDNEWGNSPVEVHQSTTGGDGQSQKELPSNVIAFRYRHLTNRGNNFRASRRRDSRPGSTTVDTQPGINTIAYWFILLGKVAALSPIFGKLFLMCGIVWGIV